MKKNKIENIGQQQNEQQQLRTFINSTREIFNAMCEDAQKTHGQVREVKSASVNKWTRAYKKTLL